MKRDVTVWYKECAVCATSKTPPHRPHGNLQKIIATSRMDLVAIDILSGLLRASDGSRYILLAMDYYTKWSECYALPDSEAKTCIWTLSIIIFSLDLALVANCTVIEVLSFNLRCLKRCVKLPA